MDFFLGSRVVDGLNHAEQEKYEKARGTEAWRLGEKANSFRFSNPKTWGVN